MNKKWLFLGLSCLCFYMPATEDLLITKVHVLDKAVSLRGIYAVNDQEAWVSGSRGSIYFTRDGGQTWQQSQIPAGDGFDFRDIEVLKDGSIVLMSAGPGNKSRIYRSRDKGDKWQEVFVNPHEKGFLNTIAFWDQNNGLAIGDPLDGRFYILVTKNGGKTWLELPRDQCPRAEPGEAGFAASGTCIAVYGKNHAWIGSVGKKARVYKTSDRGKTWQAFATTLLQGEASTGVFSIFFKDKINGIVVGGDYKKISATQKTAALSKDGGKTWNLVTDTKLPFLSSVKLVMLNGEPCYLAAGPAGVYLTGNNLEWKKISSQGFHCLSVDKKGESAWLAGSGGRVAAIRIPR